MKFAYGKFGAPIFLKGVPMRTCTQCKGEFPMDEMFALTPLPDPEDKVGYTVERLKEVGLLRCKDCIPVDAVDGEAMFESSKRGILQLFKEGDNDAGKGDSGAIESSVPGETRD